MGEGSPRITRLRTAQGTMGSAAASTNATAAGTPRRRWRASRSSAAGPTKARPTVRARPPRPKTRPAAKAARTRGGSRRPRRALGKEAREQDEGEGEERRVQRLGHGRVRELDRVPVQRVGDAGPAPAGRSGRALAEVAHRHRDRGVERGLHDEHEHEALAGDGQQPGQEEVVQGRDGPRPAQRPLAPLVAGQDEAPRGGVLEDAERALPVVVLVREEQRLVGAEAVEEAGERARAGRGPPTTAAGRVRRGRR